MQSEESKLLSFWASVEFAVGEPCPFEACKSRVRDSGLTWLAGIEHESHIAILVLAEISVFAFLFLPQWFSTLGTVDQTESSYNKLAEAIKAIISKLEISFTSSCGNKLSYYIARTNSRHIGSSFRTDYLYGESDHDLLAVSGHVKVDPRTLHEYFRKRHGKYRVVWRVRNS